jgi:alpha-L-fucosidase/acetyl esterase/lipase
LNKIKYCAQMLRTIFNHGKDELKLNTVELVGLILLFLFSCRSYCGEQNGTKNTLEIIPAENNYTIIPDVEYLGPDRQEKMDVYLPSDSRKAPVPAVIWIHGGGWSGGDKVNNRVLDLINTITSGGYAVFSINYLLVKYNKDDNGNIIYPIERDAFPQNIYDCKTAVRFVRKNARTYNVDPDKIVVGGASAGGHLAMITGMTSGVEIDDGGLYRDYPTDVSGMISFYGPTDLNKFGGHMFAGETRYKCDKYSPVNYISEKTPPMFITHGNQDDTVKFSNTIDFIDKIKDFEQQNDCKIDYTFIPVENGRHSYFASPEEKNCFYDLRPHILAFLKRVFKDKAKLSGSFENNAFQVRDGLPNLFAKISAGQDVTIAYFGGSITAQPGYRSQTFQWFLETWPSVEFTHVDAAIGGTGSELGAFRLQKDVLVHKPDLIFIEFAVNDYKAAQNSADGVIASVEGIVRQVIRDNPETDMCFVYTITEQVLNDMKEGGGFTSMLAHEKVADHYGIPSINMGLPVAIMEAAGELVMKGAEGKPQAVSGESLNALTELPVNDKGQVVFAKDGVHPYPNSGHKIYTQAVTDALPMLKGKPIARKLMKPLRSDNLENAKMISLKDVKLSGDWQEYDWNSPLLSAGIRKRMPEIMFTDSPGDSISFRFRGRVAGFYDIMGPSAGVVEANIDGSITHISRFDKYCTYYRINSRTIDLEEGVHDVCLTFTDRRLDKSAILKERDSVIDDISRYEPQKWHVGSVMLIGEIVPASEAVDNTSALPQSNIQEKDLFMKKQNEFSSWQFGLFLHFNMGTFANLEWTNGYEDPKIFAPGKLDCGQWAAAAAAAGMKYGILTAKHTGGWCLWPSAYTRHGVQSFSNFKEGKGDIVREFVDAFRARGIKAGLYYCFPGDYAEDPRFSKPVPEGMTDLHGLPPEAAGDYTGFIKKQIKELLTEYKPDMMWIDQYGNKYTGKDWPHIKAYIHELAPGCIVIANNARSFEQSDVLSYEWPLTPEGRASKNHGLPGHVGMLPPAGNTNWAEVCDTIQTQARWFWHPGLEASDLQSPDRMSEIYSMCRSRNANYLLNVPPNRDGPIPEEYVRRIKKIHAQLQTDTE